MAKTGEADASRIGPYIVVVIVVVVVIAAVETRR
jgi:hypothetical protein